MAAASVDRLDKARDAELQQKGFLDGAAFPKISFESTNVAKTGDRTGKIIGNLTMAGGSDSRQLAPSIQVTSE